MGRNRMEEKVILDAVVAIWTGNDYYIADYQHVMFTLSSASSANFTIKFQWSFSDVAPDFSAAQSNTNRWDYIQVKDYQNNSSIDGDTWVAFTGTDDVRQFEMNTNWLKWICATVTARSAWSVSLRLVAFNNQ